MKLRVGMVGTGFIARYHARAVAACEGAELTCVASLTEDLAETFAREHAIGATAPTLGAMLERRGAEAIDAVVLGTPNALHAPQAIAALEAGKHVLVEKPMATSAADADAMRAAALEAGRQILVGHMWRYDREALYLHDVVKQGKLGRILRATSYGVHLNWGPSGWFVDRSLAGGGALVDMGVHAIDTARFLMGDPDPVRVYARMQTAFGDYDVDDVGIVVVDWDNGATLVVESGWWSPHASGPEASTELYGTKGYGRLFPTKLELPDGENVREQIPDLPPRADHCDQHAYDAQMLDFVTCAHEGRMPRAGAEVGRTVMRVCDAAYASAKSGQAVALED